MSEIDLHRLRDPAEKLHEITDEMWQRTNEESRTLVEEFLSVSKQLSPKTHKQYISCLRQFFWFVCEKFKNKPFNEITKRDFMKYMSWMQERGLSSAAIGVRKSSVSSFCNYIENIVAEDIPSYKNFRNFTRGMPSIAKNSTYDKIPITEEEYRLILKVLEERKDYLGCAWVATMYNVGCRRAELIQFKTEILSYKIPENQNYVYSHIVRGKGKSVDGKPLKYMIPLEALKYMQLWIDNRGYDSEYIFAVKYDGKINHISTTWGNHFCTEILSPIVSRRINPHLFKSSCITALLAKGKDLKVISKYVAQHNDTATTSNFYDLRNFDSEKSDIFS
jgi:site-specific recombinase XerD